MEKERIRDEPRGEKEGYLAEMVAVVVRQEEEATAEEEEEDKE